MFRPALTCLVFASVCLMLSHCCQGVASIICSGRATPATQKLPVEIVLDEGGGGRGAEGGGGGGQDKNTGKKWHSGCVCSLDVLTVTACWNRLFLPYMHCAIIKRWLQIC